MEIRSRVKNGSIRPHPQIKSTRPLFSRVLEDEASAPFLENLPEEEKHEFTTNFLRWNLFSQVRDNDMNMRKLVIAMLAPSSVLKMCD